MVPVYIILSLEALHMDRGNYAAIMESERERSILSLQGMQKALVSIEKLPQETDRERMEKLSAYGELLEFLLSTSELLWSLQDKVTRSLEEHSPQLRPGHMIKAG